MLSFIFLTSLLPLFFVHKDSTDNCFLANEMEEEQISSDITTSEIDYDYDDDMEQEDEAAAGPPTQPDPEYVAFKCYKEDDVAKLLREEALKLTKKYDVNEDEAAFLLNMWKYDSDMIAIEVKRHGPSFFHVCNLRMNGNGGAKVTNQSSKIRSSPCSELCQICFATNENMRSLQCGHEFCKECYGAYVGQSLQTGISAKLECMESKCRMQALSTFVSEILNEQPLVLKQYRDRLLHDAIKSHPHFRYCPGTDCRGIIFCESRKAFKVACDFCKTSFW